jgi:hypothetical protein
MYKRSPLGHLLYILGVNGYHRDALEVIIRDGEWIAAVEEERFNRKKNCAVFPTAAMPAERGCAWWVEATSMALPSKNSRS